ncbi:hypothetical protein Esti_000096 [Eimeria stiedai]
MEEAERTPQLRARRCRLIRKRLDSDESNAEDGARGPAKGSSGVDRPPEQEEASSPPPADNEKTEERDGDGLRRAAAEASSQPARRLRLKGKRGDASSRESSSSERSTPRRQSAGTSKKIKTQRATRRSSSTDTFSSPSSDADEMSDSASEKNSSRSSSSSEEEDLSEGEGGSSPSRKQKHSWRAFGGVDGESEAQFQEALAWCLDRIIKEGQTITTTTPEEQRQYEVALWDDELTRGGTRHFADAFLCEPTRALNAQQLPAITPEEKAIVFLDYPNEVYQTEFLHLRVVEPRSRRVVLANLLKCAADQQAACREFDKWVEKNKRFFITQEERLNKLFHLRVAEPKGLRKLQHFLMRAEQCGLVERSKLMDYRRAAAQPQEEDLKVYESRGGGVAEGSAETDKGAASSGLLFGADDSQYSQEDFSGDESHSRTWNESSTRGWAALKRRNASGGALSHSGCAASMHVQTLKARAKEEQKRRQEHRDAEKKQARRAALLQRWADLQRLARSTHDGPRFHHPSREEHSKAQRFAARGFSFARSDVVYIQPPLELQGRHREALAAYLRQLPRMHKLLAEPHKLVLASKYGLVSVTESTDLVSPPTMERNADPWLQREASSHWAELQGVFGYAPWDVLEAGGGFIPPSLAQRLREKAEGQAAAVVPAKPTKEEQSSAAGMNSIKRLRETLSKGSRDVAADKHAGEASQPATPQRTKRVQENRSESGGTSADPWTPISATSASRRPGRGETTPRSTPAPSSRLRGGGIPRISEQRGASEVEPQAAATVAAAIVAAAAPQECSSSASQKDKEAEQLSPRLNGTPRRPQAQLATEATGGEAIGLSMEVEKEDACILDVDEQRSDQPVKEAPLGDLKPSLEGGGVAAEPQKNEMGTDERKNNKTSAAVQSPLKAAADGEQQRQKTRGEGKMTYEGPRQMKLTDLLRFTLNKVKGKVAIAISGETLRCARVDEGESDDDFAAKTHKSSRRRRLIDDEPPVDVTTTTPTSQPQDQSQTVNEEATAGPSGKSAAPSACEAGGVTNGHDSDAHDEPTAANISTNSSEPTDEEEARRQEKRRQKQQRRQERAEAIRRQRKLERKKQMRDILRQMMEYEAEENDEELKDDAEYAAALEELKHRLAREGDDDEEELEDSDEEFLEDLIAKPEDADEDERNEDRAAMTMKLQRDLGEREEEVYERLIGRYQRSGREGGVELTEQEMLELELEERRRNVAKRRKLLGDGALAGLDIDDWLSESEDSGEDSSSSEEGAGEEAEQQVLRWSTLALEGTTKLPTSSVSTAVATPADLAAKCQANATRPRNPASKGAARRPSASEGHREGRASVEAQGRKESDSEEDEMKILYRTAPKVHAPAVAPLQRGTSLRGPSSCIRFSPNQHQDLELSNSSRQEG